MENYFRRSPDGTLVPLPYDHPLREAEYGNPDPLAHLGYYTDDDRSVVSQGGSSFSYEVWRAEKNSPYARTDPFVVIVWTVQGYCVITCPDWQGFLAQVHQLAGPALLSVTKETFLEWNRERVRGK